MATQDGIITLPDGSQTYAPDGHPSSTSRHASHSARRPMQSATVPSSSGPESDLDEKSVAYDNVPLDDLDHRRFEPIHAGDVQELTRLASRLSTHRRRSSFATEADDGDLERKDTITGLELDNPVFDPSSKSFDLYKWVRMFMRSIAEEDFKVKRAGFVIKNLNVSGSGSALQLQKNVASILMAPVRLNEYFSIGHKPEKHILRDFNALLETGELLVVLGRPGSGCSTFLKSVCGVHHGLEMDKKSTIHYNGIPQPQMVKEFRGELVYNQEVDKHFPHLTVGETLEFAASARTPSNRVRGMSRSEWAKHMAQVVMTVFGLSHTYNTKVGNDFVRGVSGGERKRVSLAEMAIAGAPIAAWDNSTRGLDAATALEFVKSLRLSADLGGSAHAVAIYQASQAIYDVFDKAVVLYEGREIYYGPASKAKQYFERMGWYCPQRQTTGDFVTSVTNPQERTPREGYEGRVPRTPDDFKRYWESSQEFADLQKAIQHYEQEYPIGGQTLAEFQASKKHMQAHHTRPQSPYMVSIPMQVKLCTKRAYQRLWNDKTSTVTTIIGQTIFALIIGSIFYGTPDATAGFFAKGAVLFFAILLNALIAITEINSLYDQRPIVEKQVSYAFYHPFTEAVAGVISDIPVKFMIAVGFNIILYFLSGLRRTPDQFFVFFVFVFISMFVMSAVFRTIAASTKTLSQAMAMAGVLVLALVIYTGFTIPVPYMVDWFGWIRWINPVFYAFEALIANEFHGREFTCSGFIPAYPILTGDAFICSVAGAEPGQRTVSGDAFIAASYNYYYSNVWRNFGILWAFLIGFMTIYFVATELNSSTSSVAEFLVFRRGHVPSYMQSLDKKQANDEELGAPEAVAKQEEQKDVNAIPPQKDIFTWRDVVYDIPVKDGTRRLLDHVNGWVKPGTLTALMGVSGAGKTTLLDVLAQRVSMGIVTGDMLVNGKPLDESFQRKTGYVQQQDLHLETSTVREALQFSAILRQPKSVPKQEKFDYVEDVIKMLNMEDFAEAVVGVPGEGLNVEQRKLLTIGVELAAKPALLLFLDEPTSGLDSQSSWAICAFLRKLADHGQAVLCTIHQPSAILFQEFDRLLFLAKGGKTVYFGDIGENSHILLEYFESHGGRKCGDEENPAEYMLEIIGAGASGKSTQDWPSVWKESEEFQGVLRELDRIHHEKQNEPPAGDAELSHAEFAMPFSSQLFYVTQRVFSQYWRTPSYIWGKLLLGIMSAVFIGFSFFQSDASQQGLQNVLFSVFILTSIFSTLVQQIMPRFVTQRSLYEVRERPSKAYSWAAFLVANIVVEIPWQIFMGILVFASYYYPIFGIQSSERQGLILLLICQFFVFASTFAQMVIAALPDAETAGNIATLLFAMTLTFNGVMQTPDALPGFWVFMYRVSPLTYFVSGMVSTGLHERSIDCTPEQALSFPPPPGQTCQEYLAPFLQQAPGVLAPGSVDSTTQCNYCQIAQADTFLAGSNIYWGNRWRDYGIGFAYIFFNIFAATALYYVFRVKKWGKKTEQKKQKNGGTALLPKIKRVFKRSGEKTPQGTEAQGAKLL